MTLITSRHKSKLNLSIIVLCTFVGLSACSNITFKKKYTQSEKAVSDSRLKSKSPKKYQELLKQRRGEAFSQTDKELIKLYYNDKANATIIAKAITLTPLSKKDKSKLKVSNHLPMHIQVIPLPLELENILAGLPRQVLRVQVSKNVILMNVKTRKIIDIIKF